MPSYRNLALVALSLVGSLRLAHADVTPTGDFTTSVAIEVPNFRGLAPDVSLRYSSHVSNGVAGIGWGLDAVSVISRVGARGGLPNGTTDDHFVLDGEELIPCKLNPNLTPTDSPSCWTAFSWRGSVDGFYSTRRESFRRIEYQGNNLPWTVWFTDGRQQTFETFDGGQNWLLTRTKDRHSNAVDYAYTCAASTECELTSLRYGDRGQTRGAEIHFYYETRSDARSRGTGTGIVGLVHRLRSVTVDVGNSLVRAYALSYVQSPVSGRSVLRSVQEFPRDAHVDRTTGIITAGPTVPMPATTLTAEAQTAPTGWQFGSLNASLFAAPTPGAIPPAHYTSASFASLGWKDEPIDVGTVKVRVPSQRLVGDFDGDGRTDVATVQQKGNCAGVLIKARLTRKIGSQDISTTLGLPGVTSTTNCTVAFWTADLNGDGTMDMLFSFRGKLYSAFLDGTFELFPSSIAWSVHPEHCTVGDVDGDSRDDLICLTNQYPAQQMVTARSRGDGTFVVTYDAPGVLETDPMASADVNGDGFDDIIMAPANGTTRRLLLYRSQGNGTYAAETQSTTWPVGMDDELVAGEIDGDGLTDIVLHERGTTGLGIALAFQGAGAGRFEIKSTTLPWTSTRFGDVDGDGKLDAVNNSQLSQAALGDGLGGFSTPSATFLLATSPQDCDEPALVDLDGDERTDLFCVNHPLPNAPVDAPLKLFHYPSLRAPRSTLRWSPMDADGDGNMDFVQVTARNPGYQVDTVLGGRRVSWTTSGPATQYDEPAAGRWLVADVGGPANRADGKDDLVLVDTAQGTLRVETLISNGDGTYTPKSDPSAWKDANYNVIPFTPTTFFSSLDIDGDGDGDLAQAFVAGGSVRVDVLRSNGDGTWSSDSRNYFAGAAPSLQVSRFRMMEVNGDGLPDLVNIEAGNNTAMIRTLVNRGDGTFAEVTDAHSSAWLDVLGWRSIDVNGDGLTDLFHVSSGTSGATSSLTFDMLIARGNGTFGTSTGSATLSTYDSELAGALEATGPLHPVDLDGNGLPDLVHIARYRSTSGTRHTVVVRMMNPGTSSPLGAWTVPTPTKVPSSVVAATTPWAWGRYRAPERFDSTGFVAFADAGPSTAMFEIASDRLAKIDNGNGGVTEVAYGPHVGTRAYLPSGYTPLVVRTVTRRDLAYSPAKTETTAYAYSGATWSEARQQLLGYTHVGTRSGDTVGLASYALGDACGGSMIRSTTIDGASIALLGYIDYTYVAPGSTPPYTCMTQQESKYTCEGSACLLQSDTQLTWSSAGVVTESSDRITDAPTRWVQTWYWPNNAAYLLDAPMARNVYEDGKLHSQRLFTYDGNTVSNAAAGPLGEVHEIASWDSTAGGYVTTTVTYNAAGLPIRATDAAGGWSETAYDPTYQAFPVSVCDPVGCTESEWDYVSGKITRTIDLNGEATAFEYDPHGRLALTTYPDGSWAESSISNLGNFTGPASQHQRMRSAKSDGSGDKVLWREQLLDGWGRTYQTIHEGGAAQTIDFDGLTARPLKVSEVFAAGTGPNYYTSYAYDALGRLITQTATDGSVKQWSYDTSGVTMTDELGRLKSLETDGSGDVISVTEHYQGAAQTTRYGYDVDRRMVGSTDPLGNVTSYYYDALGRMIGESDPDRGLREYTYRADGKLLSLTDAKGQHIDYTYDRTSRLVKREDVDAYGKVQRTVSWTYDEIAGLGPSGASIGRPVVVEDDQPNARMKTTFEYDRMGRLSRDENCIDGACYEMGYTYDLAGRIRELSYPDASGKLGGESVRHSYDDAGRLIQVGPYMTRIDYAIDNRRTHLVYGNGLETEYTYDPARRWPTNLSVGKGTIYEAAYRRDGQGRIVDMDETAPTGNASMQFTYDELGRIRRVQSTDPQLNRDFVFDAIGRITYNSKLGDYHYTDPDHPHAMTRADLGALRAYDVNGNVKALRDPNGRELKIAWTVDDRPNLIDGGSAGTFEYAYDASGRRVKKQGPNGTSLYPNNFLAVEGGAIVKYYYAGDRLVARNDGKLLYYHDDHSRATRVETDHKGNVVNSYQYDVVGEVVQTNETVADDIGFGGVHGDEDIGITYMNARYYDPVSARFLSADSVVRDAFAPQSHDRYAFVEGDPVNNWDPTGHRMRNSLAEREGRGGITGDPGSALMDFFGSGNDENGICKSTPQFCESAVTETKVGWNSDGSVAWVVPAGTGASVASWMIQKQLDEGKHPDEASGGGFGGSGSGRPLSMLLAMTSSGMQPAKVENLKVVAGATTIQGYKVDDGAFKGTEFNVTVMIDKDGKVVGFWATLTNGPGVTAKPEMQGDLLVVVLTKDTGEKTSTTRIKSEFKGDSRSEDGVTSNTGGGLGLEVGRNAAKIAPELKMDRGFQTKKESGAENSLGTENENVLSEKITIPGSVTFHLQVTPIPVPVIKETPRARPNGIIEWEDARTGEIIKRVELYP